MADPGTPIPFTVGDQDRLVRIEEGLKNLLKNPPLQDRVVALETSRTRGLYGMVTFMAGAALYGLKLFVEWIGGGG